jgi:hypothetical protein
MASLLTIRACSKNRRDALLLVLVLVLENSPETESEDEDEQESNWMGSSDSL